MTLPRPKKNLVLKKNPILKKSTAVREVESHTRRLIFLSEEMQSLCEAFEVLPTLIEMPPDRAEEFALDLIYINKKMKALVESFAELQARSRIK
jgi:hypothetical protein